jgi:lipopolysaccharide/colanic/teichoic acid biosynthesis glycosyltransferase
MPPFPAKGETGVSYPFIKRLMDVIGGLVGLCVTALFYIPLGIAIKMDSPGPVLFAQDRLGKDETLFRIYKFRTMHLDVPNTDSKPVVDDSRVTRLGRWLRRTSLDELPQFYNVLRGDMSLVGPRPEQLPLAAHYHGSQRRRFSVKPGLTGWWQVNGRLQPMYEHVEFDIYYVDHHCLRLDLLILLRSIRAILSGEGAV